MKSQQKIGAFRVAAGVVLTIAVMSNATAQAEVPADVAAH
jgi:hypothetical protein